MKSSFMPCFCCGDQFKTEYYVDEVFGYPIQTIFGCRCSERPIEDQERIKQINSELPKLGKLFIENTTDNEMIKAAGKLIADIERIRNYKFDDGDL